MKNFAPFLIVLTFSTLNGFSQRSDYAGANSKVPDLQLMADESSEKDNLIASYHVKETINMTFGGSVTTYDVSQLSLVATNDLGKNNSRVVTSKFSKVKAVAPPLEIKESKPETVVESTRPPIVALELPKPVSVDIIHKVSGQKYVYVDILDTYERILEKGYASIDMLKRVANGRFFDGNLVISAKWYTKLFALTSDLEPVYYYRYAASLKAVGQLEKANEIMKIFEKNKDL